MLIRVELDALRLCILLERTRMYAPCVVRSRRIGCAHGMCRKDSKDDYLFALKLPFHILEVYSVKG